VVPSQDRTNGLNQRRDSLQRWRIFLRKNMYLLATIGSCVGADKGELPFIIDGDGPNIETTKPNVNECYNLKARGLTLQSNT
jgi:hypothetical protein